jgi:DNA repair exonuclease SbcCD nuclease subunit
MGTVAVPNGAKMKVAVISDLHLEFADLTLPGGDVLILSGDVFESKNLKPELYKSPEAVAALGDLTHVIMEGGRSDRRQDRYYRFLKEECGKYREVFYVAGNHEYYHNTYNRVDEQLRAGLPENIHFLQNQSYVLDGVLFLGATLWTDMNGHNPITMNVVRECMNDYRTIKFLNETKNAWYRLTPEITLAEHRKTMAWLKEQLDANRAGDQLPVVVVGHHAPSKRSTKPEYQDDYHVNGAYSSHLDMFIEDYPEIRVWTHGHTHDVFDYTVGQTRILCNPRGYKGYEQRAEEFDPTVGFDI